ncbi:nucleoside-diphosphate kinase [Candidatus Dependentiae bacterium]|nr:nucleoside-diphosphate kinase [Candidatus Dependentiae bacterium]
MEKTFAIIKPGAVKAGHANAIIDMIKKDGFIIARKENITITKNQAEELYAEHASKPFFHEMVQVMTSSPVIVMSLEKPNAVKAWRDLMGATDPLKAEKGTIRALYGKSISENAVHGSDSIPSAIRETDIFFPERKKSCCAH